MGIILGILAVVVLVMAASAILKSRAQAQRLSGSSGDDHKGWPDNKVGDPTPVVRTLGIVIIVVLLLALLVVGGSALRSRSTGDQSATGIQRPADPSP